MGAKVGIPVLILKEGTQRTTGRDARRANILAAIALAESVKTSLGPRGMDKMLVDSFGDVTITGDGATILKEMEIQHPAAKMLVEVAKAQDDEVGDGTTSVVVLAGELLKNAADLLDQEIHPSIIMEGYEEAMKFCLKEIDKVAEEVKPLDKDVLKKVAMTALGSKAVSEYKGLLADIAVEAALKVIEKRGDKYYIDIDNVKVEKKKGESLAETQLVHGIVIDKEVVHPAMPRRVENAKIALLNCPLEVQKPEITAKIHITSPEQMKAFLDQEIKMLKKMVDRIRGVGANVVFCQKGIDDVAQHFLAKAGILAVRRVKKSDMEKLARATGARIVTSIDDLSEKDLGYAKLVEERKVADEKMVFVEGCKNPRAVTILIRGGAEHVVDEAERAVHDALCVVRNVVHEPRIVAGGGALEIELASRVRNYAMKFKGKKQLAIQKFADALEAIPTILAQTAGIEPVDALVELRQLHSEGKKWAGVDVLGGKIVEDMLKLNIIEPAIVKKQVIKSATEAALMILRIDDIIAAAPPKEKKKKEGEEAEKFKV